LKSKDEMLKVTKKRHADIADLRQKYQLVVFMRDDAGEKYRKGSLILSNQLEKRTSSALLMSNGKWTCGISNQLDHEFGSYSNG
jgi:hypothetical protein